MYLDYINFELLMLAFYIIPIGLIIALILMIIGFTTKKPTKIYVLGALFISLIGVALIIIYGVADRIR